MGFVRRFANAQTFENGYLLKNGQISMPANRPLLSIVIPVSNEVSTSEKTLRRLHYALEGLSFEIIIVDYGSTDGTAKLVRKLSDDRILPFFHKINRGKWAALWTAFPYALG